MKPFKWPSLAIMVVLLALIPAACGTEIKGGVKANTIEPNSMVGGVTSSGSGGSSSVAYMQGVNDLSNNVQVNNAQLQSVINVLGGSIQKAVDSANNGDTIKVWPGLYKENVHVPVSVTIQGSGALWTIVDGQQKDSVFEVGSYSGAVVTLSDMTIRNGKKNEGGGINNVGHLTVNRCNIIKNTANFEGGGIYNGGTLNLNNVLITDNTAGESSVVTSGEDGGGIFNNGGTVYMHDGDIIARNTAKEDGGGICNAEGTVNMNGGFIDHNTANENGGGIDNFEGTVNMNGGFIACNTAKDDGGGIYNFYSTVNLNGGLITGNKANLPTPSGGGIYNLGGTITGNTGIVRYNMPDQIKP
jgi:hypothetical protein